MIEFRNEQDIDSRRTVLFEELSKKVCIVKFTKVDGSLREMPCTLFSALLPESSGSASKPKTTKNDSVMSVWCTDKSSWRSFRIENVISIGDINA